ncbi:hypothetical protein CN514_21015 [Bacillus sp. AFS001701]|nr:hypothetical protein CN514_21015 [Bacillus sp. AFS001701]
MIRIDFKTYLGLFIEDESSIGRLARSVQHDDDFPKEIKVFEELETYLKFKGTDKVFLGFAKEAWEKYQDPNRQLTIHERWSMDEW